MCFALTAHSNCLSIHLTPYYIAPHHQKKQLQARLAAAVKARIDYTVRVVGRAGSRQHIIDGVVMKERTRMAAEGASPSVAAVLAGRGAEEASAV